MGLVNLPYVANLGIGTASIPLALTSLLLTQASFTESAVLSRQPYEINQSATQIATFLCYSGTTLKEAIQEVISNLVANSSEIDPEIAKVINEEFINLLA